MVRSLVSTVTACLLSLVGFFLLLTVQWLLAAALQSANPDQILAGSVYSSFQLVYLLEGLFLATVIIYMYKRKQFWTGPSKTDRHFLFGFLIPFGFANLILLKYPLDLQIQIFAPSYDGLLADLVPDLILMHGLAFLAIYAVIVMSRHYPDRA